MVDQINLAKLTKKDNVGYYDFFGGQNAVQKVMMYIAL